MFRVLGLVGVLMALLIVALLYKHQITAQSVAKPSAPEVNTPAQGKQLQQQIENDLNKAAQNQRQQLEQSVERSTQ